MPPKPAKKEKKDDLSEYLGQEVGYLDNLIKTLKVKLIQQTEIAQKTKAAENELRARIIELEKDLENDEEKMFSISADMTRQYKSMQEELQNQISSLKNKVSQQEETLKMKAKLYDDIYQDKKLEYEEKENEISMLRRKIEDMTNEFAKMLRETLEKMQEKIELAQWDTDNDPQIMKRLKEMAGLNVDQK